MSAEGLDNLPRVRRFLETWADADLEPAATELAAARRRPLAKVRAQLKVCRSASEMARGVAIKEGRSGFGGLVDMADLVSSAAHMVYRDVTPERWKEQETELVRRLRSGDRAAAFELVSVDPRHLATFEVLDLICQARIAVHFDREDRAEAELFLDGISAGLRSRPKNAGKKAHHDWEVLSLYEFWSAFFRPLCAALKRAVPADRRKILHRWEGEANRLGDQAWSEGLAELRAGHLRANAAALAATARSLAATPETVEVWLKRAKRKASAGGTSEVI